MGPEYTPAGIDVFLIMALFWFCGQSSSVCLETSTMTLVFTVPCYAHDRLSECPSPGTKLVLRYALNTTTLLEECITDVPRSETHLISLEHGHISRTGVEIQSPANWTVLRTAELGNNTMLRKDPLPGSSRLRVLKAFFTRVETPLREYGRS